jgi:hypothetical protein
MRFSKNGMLTIVRSISNRHDITKLAVFQTSSDWL